MKNASKEQNINMNNINKSESISNNFQNSNIKGKKVDYTIGKGKNIFWNFKIN